MSGAGASLPALFREIARQFGDAPPDEPVRDCPELHWISVRLLDPDGEAVVEAPFGMKLTTGREVMALLEETQRWDEIPAGLCTFDLRRFWVRFRRDLPGLFPPGEPVPPAPGIPAIEPLPPSPPADLVAEAQRRLTRLGYAPGPVDGIQGPRTNAALAKWQREHGLAPDTTIDEALLLLLQPEADPRVAELQAALNARGYDCGAADGWAGARTMAAIRRWKRAHGEGDGPEVDDGLLGRVKASR